MIENLSASSTYEVIVQVTQLMLKNYRSKRSSQYIPAKRSQYDEESDHSNKAVRKTPEIESGHKVSEEVK